MASRHTIDPDNWESVFRRLEELVVANSGEDVFDEVFKLLIAKLFQERFRQNESLYGESSVDTALRVGRALSSASKEWAGILPESTRPLLTDSHLHVCAEVLDKLDLQDSQLEVMDAAFEHLLTQSSKSAKGQFFTPRYVVEACVQMIDPKPGESVLDPACGSGAFLIHSLLHTRGKFGSDHITLTGGDIDPRAIQISRALMLIAGATTSTLEQRNSLSDTSPSQSAESALYDVVLTNPPFAGEVREADLISQYALGRTGRRNERDTLFLERSVRSLKPGGRMAIVLPTNKVGSASYSFARQWLLREFRVLAVLSLGRNTFRPHTSQKADIIVGFRRLAPARIQDIVDEHILFLGSERDGKDAKGNYARLLSGDEKSGGPTGVDHDLFDAVRDFHDFLDSEAVAWGN